MWGRGGGILALAEWRPPDNPHHRRARPRFTLKDGRCVRRADALQCPLIMRLADFILQNIEPILVEWEAFARSIWPGEAADPATLRDHAEEILRATAADMMAAQTGGERSAKS